MSTSTPRLARDRALLGEVRVDPLRGGPGLRDDDRPERDEQAEHRRREDDVDHRDRKAARKAEPRQVADERVERERDHGGGEEQEDDVAERAGEQEGEHERDREHDELHPTRDPDPRRRRHAAIVALALAVRPLRSAGDEGRCRVRYRALDGLAALPASRPTP